MTPQNNGGANWEGGAVDPETGFVYVGSQTGPVVIALQKNPQFNADYISGGGAPLPRIQGLPLVKPPYSRITAYDMNKGEIAWQVAAGDTPPEIKNNPVLQGLNVPRTGSLSRPVFMVTKTLLFEGEGLTGQPAFRALDKMTGETVWEVKTPGPLSGVPMTYMYQGRQFVVFSAGDNATQTPAQLVAFALPERAPASGARGQRGQAPAPDQQ
jgi:quinoprotein glucose dehydrogenase